MTENALLHTIDSENFTYTNPNIRVQTEATSLLWAVLSSGFRIPSMGRSAMATALSRSRKKIQMRIQDPKVAPLETRKEEASRRGQLEKDEKRTRRVELTCKVRENLPDTDVGPDEVRVGHGWGDNLNDGGGESGHEEVDGEDETLDEGRGKKRKVSEMAFSS